MELHSMQSDKPQKITLKYKHTSQLQRWARSIPQPSSYMEFGVYQGKTIYLALQHFKHWNVDFRAIYGFDSFCGLPTEWEGFERCSEWEPGVYSTLDWLQKEQWGSKSPEEACRLLESWLQNTWIPVVLVPNFYKDLTIEHAKLVEWKAGFVNIDCDLYSSTMEAYTFLMENDLMLPNAIVRYDDWNMDNKFEEWTAGESLCHVHITEKYNVQWERLAQNIFRYLGCKS